MAEKATKGTHLLTDKDFVDVVDADGNDLPPVPKHWGEDQLPAGAKKKSGSSSSSRAAKKTAKKAPAKKTASPDAGGAESDDTSGDGGSA